MQLNLLDGFLQGREIPLHTLEFVLMFTQSFLDKKYAGSLRVRDLLDGFPRPWIMDLQHVNISLRLSTMTTVSGVSTGRARASEPREHEVSQEGV